MLRYFRTIRKKLIEQDNVRKYLLYAIGEILLVVIGKPCPVRDNIWVETMESPKTHSAVRYGICRNRDVAINHIAYLRHAALCLHSDFYRYVVPTGHISKPGASAVNVPHSI